MSDPYVTLGVSRSSSDDEIKAAYRKLAMKFHPDQNPDKPEAEARFKEINAAYDQIKDSQKRAQHEQTSFGQGGWGGFRPGGMGGGPHHFEFTGGDFNSMDELLRAFHQRQHTPQNRNFNTTCAISLEDAYNGCEVILKVNQPTERDIRVKIPAGVDNGTRIRVHGAGENSIADQPPGDLHVVIQIIPHPFLERRGRHLYSTVEVSAIDAMLGLGIKVPTIDGDEVEITPPGGFKSGWMVRISNRGVTTVASPNRGDHIVTVVLTIPNELSADQKRLLEDIKRLSE